MKRRGRYQHVTPNVVKGRVYWRFRLDGFSCNLPGPYGSPEFQAAYEAALEGARTPRTTAIVGTLAWVIEHYLGSVKYRNLSDSRKRSIRGELDWLKGVAGKYHYDRLGVRHVEALMAKKSGPTAANTVKKNLSMLFNYAARKLDYTGPNPARFAERHKENPDGYHTWTLTEIEQFRRHHASGTKARLALELFLGTGASRQDAARLGWQNVLGGRLEFRRHKTGIPVSIRLDLIPELAAELAFVPSDRLLFLTHTGDRPYKPETLGNWFRDQCSAAGVPGSAHGLRKASATRLADNEATPDEIRGFLGHKTNKQGSTYTDKADRGRLADNALAKVSNLSDKLDKKGGKTHG